MRHDVLTSQLSQPLCLLQSDAQSHIFGEFMDFELFPVLGSCTAAPTTSPTLAPTLSPTKNSTTLPISSIPVSNLMWTKNAEMFEGGGYVGLILSQPSFAC